MAVLSDEDRRQIWARFMRDNREPLDVEKDDLRDVVDALDGYMNTNAAVINAAIPLPGRSSLTTAQKARLLALVVEQRYVRES